MENGYKYKAYYLYPTEDYKEYDGLDLISYSREDAFSVLACYNGEYGKPNIDHYTIDDGKELFIVKEFVSPLAFPSYCDFLENYPYRPITYMGGSKAVMFSLKRAEKNIKIDKKRSVDKKLYKIYRKTSTEEVFVKSINNIDKNIYVPLESYQD